MKQLLLLSGKGGTGKTTMATAFIKLSAAKLYADCDVDAPNLHLLISGSAEPIRTDYYGMKKAQINEDLCTRCDLCRKNCRFDAIRIENNYKVDSYACEGCGVCEMLCPAGAITLQPAIAGEVMLYTGDAVFSTAKLKMGSGTTGKLVTEVKKRMKTAGAETSLAIIDGSPGIGCPVIASLSGVDMVLIVAEPSVSGISDMERILKTAKIFGTKACVCINKADTNPANCATIKSFCTTAEIPFVGEIPFDPLVVKAVNNAQSIVDIDCMAGRAAKEVFDKTMNILFNKG